MVDLQWTDSRSSNVASYAYEHASRRLHVRFRNGTTGAYENVPPEMHREFSTAESHGTFIHTRLKNRDEHPWSKPAPV